MAFMDQISKKLTDIGQNVSQQAKNFADATRINSVIDEKRRKIPQIYTAIGQAYYERHKDDTDAEELENIKEINTLFVEIAQHEEEIKQIKGITKCPKCGADVANGAAFCSSCGAQIPKLEVKPAQQVSGPRCPKCGATIKEGNLFCNFCGTQLDAPASETELHEQQAGFVAATPEQTKTADSVNVERRCPSCGAIIKDGNMFCNACGAKIAEE